MAVRTGAEQGRGQQERHRLSAGETVEKKTKFQKMFFCTKKKKTELLIKNSLYFYFIKAHCFGLFFCFFLPMFLFSLLTTS